MRLNNNIPIALSSLPLRGLIGPVVVIAVATAVQLGGRELQDLLAFDRGAVTGGAYWRLLTAAFVHSGPAHLALNCAGVVVLWLLSGEHYTFWRYVTVLAVSALLACTGMLLFVPGIEIYFGLSGALHGIFVWGVLVEFRREWKINLLLLAGLVAKLVLEQVSGATRDVEMLIGVAVASEAHVFGAIGGVLCRGILAMQPGRHQ